MVNAVGSMLYAVMTLYIYHISNDYFLVGLMMALPFLAAVPMSFIWGMVSDRLGNRRYVVAFGGVVGGALFFALPYTDAVGMIALRFVQVLFTSSWVLVNAIVTEYYPANKGRSVGDVSLMGALGGTLGGLAAGFIVPASALELGSPEIKWMFFAAGILTAISALAILAIRETPKKAGSVSMRNLLHFGERRQVGLVAAVALILPLGGYVVFSVFPIYLSGLDIGWDSTMTTGVFVALSAVTGILASGLAGRACDRFGRKWVLFGAGIWYVAVWLGMGLFRDPIITAVLWALPVWNFFYISATAAVSDLTKDEERGRGIGLVNSAINLGGAIGSILAGYLLARGAIDNFFFLAAAIAVVGTIVALGVKETLVKPRGSQR